MARVCEVSGKGVMRGGTRQHKRGSSGGTSGPWAFKATRKPREWKPNLRKVDVKIGAVKTSIKISMKYYKKLRETGKIWVDARNAYAFFPAN